jgi:hypothetical protein
VHRNSAIFLPLGPNTDADQTCVVRPRWSATHSVRSAFLGGAEEIALQLDRREVAGTVGQMRDRRVARAGVGEQDDAGCMQVAVRRRHPRLQLDLAAETPLRDLGDPQFVQTREGAGLPAVEISGADPGPKHRGVPAGG